MIHKLTFDYINNKPIGLWHHYGTGGKLTCKTFYIR